MRGGDGCSRYFVMSFLKSLVILKTHLNIHFSTKQKLPQKIGGPLDSLEKKAQQNFSHQMYRLVYQNDRMTPKFSNVEFASRYYFNWIRKKKSCNKVLQNMFSGTSDIEKKTRLSIMAGYVPQHCSLMQRIMYSKDNGN